MKDERMSGAVDAPEAESRPEGAAERANEDWSWMVGEDPTFYLQESDRSRGGIDRRDPALVDPLTELGSSRW